MMEREWRGVLSRYGQRVVLRRGEENTPIRALLQPMLERGTLQQLPTALGLGRQERFLYLGPPDQPLDMETRVEWQGREYWVQNTHKVGEGGCPHWWAVLYPGDEVGA